MTGDVESLRLPVGPADWIDLCAALKLEGGRCYRIDLNEDASCPVLLADVEAGAPVTDEAECRQLRTLFAGDWPCRLVLHPGRAWMARAEGGEATLYVSPS